MLDSSCRDLLNEQLFCGFKIQYLARVAIDPFLDGTDVCTGIPAYIASFPLQSGQATIEGNASRGQMFYTTCGNCHGRRGEGNYAMNAPRLAGQEDWYLKRQIENFKQGTRGAHPNDEFGQQMTLMAKMLKDDTSVTDVIAYINTLKPEDGS